MDYRPPHLVEGKEWYIEYYASDTQGVLRRVRIKFNRIKSVKERRRHANKVVAELERKLSSGWSPFFEQEATRAYEALWNIFDRYEASVKRTFEPNTVRTYHGFIGILKKWLVSRHFDETMLVSQFTPRVASDFIISLRSNPDKYSPRTCNNYLRFGNSLWNWMMEYNFVAENPFRHIKPYPRKLYTKKRAYMTDQQRNDLCEYLVRQGNYNYLAMCLLTYYCFIRPKELGMLRVRDIDLEHQIVHISKEIAKNDKDSDRTIPDVAMPVLSKLKLDVPEDWYLFSVTDGYEFGPGTRPCDERAISNFWARHVRPALDWPTTIQFYSLKDTGITNMIADGVAVNEVQGQADHSSLAMTSIYSRKVTPRAKKDIKEKPKPFTTPEK